MSIPGISSPRLSERRSICDVKSTQVLHALSSQCSIDYEVSLQTSKSQRDRRRSLKATPFWKSRDLQASNLEVTDFFLVPAKCPNRR